LRELIRLLSELVALLKSRRGGSPNPPESHWAEPFLYEYALSRYEEIDELIAKGRQSAQSLLTWQTALFVGAVGLAAKGGLFNFRSHEFWVGLVTAAYILALGASVLLSARVAFWTEPVDVPVSPRRLMLDLCGKGIQGRALCDNLIEVYDSSKLFNGQLQRRIRTSLIVTAAGLALFLLLLLLLSAYHLEIIEKMFSSAEK
jgi:hypothetical protein